jgi:small subunit ribosomal protein S16
MVKIRLMRVGKRKQPSYRVVVADSRSPRDGRIIEAIGHYHPRQEPSLVAIDTERAVFWLQRGAQPSDSVRNLLRISGAWSEFTGEAPPTPLATSTPAAKAAAPAKPKKATPAASVTVAESVADDEAPDAADAAGEPPAAIPEADDQEAAAPEAGAAKDEG